MENSNPGWFCRICFERHEPGTQFDHWIGSIKAYGLTEKQIFDLEAHARMSSDPLIHELLAQIDHLESYIESLETIIEKI